MSLVLFNNSFPRSLQFSNTDSIPSLPFSEVAEGGGSAPHVVRIVEVEDLQ